MNKTFAVFLFALGLGLSVPVTADTCMFHCQAAKAWCKDAAGSDTAAQAACDETFIACAADC